MIIQNLFHTEIVCDKYNVNTESSPTVSVTVTCLDFNGVPVVNKSVSLYYDNTLLTTANTDSNGVITYSRSCANDTLGLHTFHTDTNGLAQIRVFRDTGWKDITFSSGYQNYDTTNYHVKYRVVGNMGEIRGQFKNNSAVTPNTTQTQFGSIPSKYAPSKAVYSLEHGSDANKFLLVLNIDGTLKWERYGTTATNTQATAGRWLNCYIKYIL